MSIDKKILSEIERYICIEKHTTDHPEPPPVEVAPSIATQPTEQ